VVVEEEVHEGDDGEGADDGEEDGKEPS